jgi:hypothetical protein
MNGEVPGPQYGLQALYPLSEDLENAVTGHAASAVNATLADDEGFETGYSPLQLVTQPEPVGPMLLDHHALRRVAEKYATQLPETLDRDSLPEHLVGELDWYEAVLADMPEDQADALRRQFIRNLHLGHLRVLANDRAGTFDVIGEGRQTVYYYHTEDGQRHEVYRSDLVFTAVQRAALKVILDGISVLFAILGVVAASLALARNVESWFGPLTDKIIAYVSGQTGSSIMTLQYILKAVLLSGRLFSFIWACITNMGYWSKLFTALSVVAQFALIIASAGTALALKLSLLGLHLGQLGVDIAKLVAAIRAAPPKDGAAPGAADKADGKGPA